jgi:hypothetical protein
MDQETDFQVVRPPDGDRWFGSWPLSASPHPRAIVIASDPEGEWIEATLDDQIILTVPRPGPSTPAVTSHAAFADGHEIVLYAETWDAGRTVCCDLFLDGRSLTTGEPIAFIAQRVRLAGTQILQRQPLLSGWKGAVIVGVFFTLIWANLVVGESTTGIGTMLGLAVMLGLFVGLGRLWLLSFEFLKSREFEQPVSGVAAVAITIVVGLGMVPVAAVAILLSRLV